MNPLHQPHKDLAVGRHMQSHSSLNAWLHFVVILQLREGKNHTEELIISTVMMFIMLPLQMRLLFTPLDSIIFLDWFVSCNFPLEINAVGT